MSVFEIGHFQNAQLKYEKPSFFSRQGTTSFFLIKYVYILGIFQTKFSCFPQIFPYASYNKFFSCDFVYTVDLL